MRFIQFNKEVIFINGELEIETYYNEEEIRNQIKEYLSSQGVLKNDNNN